MMQYEVFDMTKRKKIVWSLIAIAVLILLVVCAYMVSVPKLNIVYEVDEHTYYQSSRSILRHEIQVDGYDQVRNVLLNDKALYATAQKGDHRYFCFMTKQQILQFLCLTRIMPSVGSMPVYVQWAIYG